MKNKHNLKLNSLSLVFPIYEEEKRIKKSLKIISNFIKKYRLLDLEIILVNDGSSDKTGAFINEFIKRLNTKYKKKIKYIYYSRNMGKGFALRKGVKSASKKWILTSDIDMSVLPTQYLKWINHNYIKNKKLSYFGSRQHVNSTVEAKNYRKFLGKFFSFVVFILFNIKLNDTQCGFKLYHYSYAKKLFNKLKENGFSHDIELILILSRMNINIKELPLKWVHKDNSKISVFYDGVKMFLDLLIIKLRYLF